MGYLCSIDTVFYPDKPFGNKKVKMQKENLFIQ